MNDLDVAYPHGCSSSTTPDKDCHLVPGLGIFPGCYEYDPWPLS